MGKPIDEKALETIFTEARSFQKWQNKDVSNELLGTIYELLKFAPTSSNCFPARFAFIHSAEAKGRLLPCLMEGNRAKISSAPVTVIIGYDTKFYELLPELWTINNRMYEFMKNPENTAKASETAFRNGSLQGAYLIFAARAVGLDCCPMSGFDNSAVDREFFQDGRIKSNFICALGYGDTTDLPTRAPRPKFSEVCTIL